MTKEQIKEYTARVAQANRTELVVIIYELLLDEIQEGNKQYQAGNTDAGEKQIRKAQGYLQELLGSLDFRYEIAAAITTVVSLCQRTVDRNFGTTQVGSFRCGV